MGWDKPSVVAELQRLHRKGEDVTRGFDVAAENGGDASAVDRFVAHACALSA